MPTPRTAVAALGLALSLALPAAAQATEPPAGGPHPPIALGISYDSHRLDFFDPATGNVYSSGPVESGSFLDADYSSVRGEAFVVWAEDGQEVIFRAPTFGPGPGGLVAYGRRVTVSPDGRFLAYVYDPDGPAKGGLMEAIAVRNLDTGAERHFPGPGRPGGLPAEMDDPAIDILAIDNLAISPDSTRLAFDYFDGGDVLVLDLVSGQSLADARPVALDEARSPAWLSDGTLAVIGENGTVRTVDLSTGGEPGFMVVPGYAEELDADDAGRLAIKLAQFSWDDTRQDSIYVLMDSNGGVTRLAKPYHTVVW
jgi:hypothetical protein